MLKRMIYTVSDTRLAKKKIKELNEDYRFDCDAIDFKDDLNNFLGTAVFDARIGEYSFVSLIGETIVRTGSANRNVPMNRVVTRSRDNGRKRTKSIYW